MKRILLLVPKGNGPGNNKRWNAQWPDDIERMVERYQWKVCTPGSLVVASLSKAFGYGVDVIDEEFGEIDTSRHYDIVGLYLVTPNANRGYMLADFFRSQGAYVVLGGVHASVCVKEAQQYADSVFVGEAEYTWPQFLKDFEKGKPQRLYIQATGEVDINQSPVPDFDAIPDNARKIIPIQTSRGCPHGCKFCNLRSIYGNAYRNKTTNKISAELEAALKINPNATIYFSDDNFFCKAKQSNTLLEEISSIRFKWYTNTDISLGDDEKLIKLAYKGGCRQVLIGFESVSKSNLFQIDENNFKSKHLDRYEELIEKIQSNGIGIIGSFIVGLPDDDHDSFQRLLDFIRKNNLYGASLTVCTPYPGTKLFNELHQSKKIETYNWDNYTIFQPIIQTNQLTLNEFNTLYINLIKEINSEQNIINKMNYFKNQLKNIRLRENSGN